MESWSRLHNSSAYNMVANRFVNPATGRFITNASGYRELPIVSVQIFIQARRIRK